MTLSRKRKQLWVLTSSSWLEKLALKQLLGLWPPLWKDGQVPCLPRAMSTGLQDSELGYRVPLVVEDLLLGWLYLGNRLCLQAPARLCVCVLLWSPLVMTGGSGWLAGGSAGLG